MQKNRKGSGIFVNDSIGMKLRILRKEKGYTQYELAERLGITRPALSNYERDRRRPSIDDLRTFAEFFGVGLDYFGVAQKDDLLDLLARAKRVFESDTVPKEKKEAVYKELMKVNCI